MRVSSQVVASPGSMSMYAKVGCHASGRRPVQAWISKLAWLPSQHRVAARSAMRWSFASRSSRAVDPGLVPAGQPGRRGRRDVLLPEAGCRRAVRETLQVERTIREVRQHRRRDPGEVADELALGDRRVRLEERLVEVGQLELVGADLPDALLAERVESRELVLGHLPWELVGRPGRALRRCHRVRAPRWIGGRSGVMVCGRERVRLGLADRCRGGDRLFAGHGQRVAPFLDRP